MKSSYDPFNRDEERASEYVSAARSEHEVWSLDQAKRGNSAAERDTGPTWVKRPDQLTGE